MGPGALCTAASEASGRTISPLYNIDLAPTKREGRRWTSYSIFTLWANDVHSLGNYAFRLRLSTSKVRTYATPRPKTVIGWPLAAAPAAATP